MSMTITDVASRAGVSKSTVSRFLNGRYDCMSTQTKERIERVIHETGYRPNAVARSLKQKKTHTIGAIIANILNPFSTSIIRGIEDTCKQSGFNLMLCNADDDPVKEKEYIEMLMSKQTDGLIINTTGCNNDLMKNVNRQMPVVLIDRKVPELNIDTVTADSFEGASLAVKYLIDLGHRDIAMFALPFRDISPRRERVEGYKQALADGGILFRPELLVETKPSDEEVQEALRALLALEKGRPTAVFGVNNLITMSLIKALKKLEIAVPRDLAVIGFDDWEWAPLLEPPITVIAQPAYEMGAKAATLLIKRIKVRKLPKKPTLIVYQPQLIARRSCGEKTE